MPSDELWVARPKKFHRRKSHVGEDWVPDITDLEAAKRRSGLICRGCHKFKPWKKLEALYEKVSKKRVWRSWVCKDCGNVVRIEEIHLKKHTVTQIKQ